MQTVSKRFGVQQWAALGTLIFAMFFSSLVAGQQRPVVVISDLHFGVGKKDGDWHSFEDFRWPNALSGFLRKLDADYPSGVDLVIAGDMLELWQHPDVSCGKLVGDCGCSIKDVIEITKNVVSQHSADLSALGAWTNRGKNNRLHIVPGNHDAALMEDEVWEIVSKAIGSVSGRVTRAKEGFWVSADQTLIVEHGHQISGDVNSFPNWPTVRKDCAAEPRLFRPWGELFVESLYSAVEGDLPIIDNLTSEVRGAFIYSKRQGFWKSAQDAARFIQFNIFQTSLRQKAQLGQPEDSGMWDVEVARKLGYRLIVQAMDPEEPLRAALLTGSTQESPELNIGELRLQLDEQVRAMDARNVKALCDQIQVRQKAGQKLDGCRVELGQMLVDRVLPLAQYLAPRLEQLQARFPKMAAYVYAHTHLADFDIAVTVNKRRIEVMNTGAFQRLIDYPTFKSKAKAKNMNEATALGKLTHDDDLAPCYSTVSLIHSQQSGWRATLRHWFMAENATSGMFVGACDRRCTALPTRCGR